MVTLIYSPFLSWLCDVYYKTGVGKPEDDDSLLIQRNIVCGRVRNIINRTNLALTMTR